MLVITPFSLAHASGPNCMKNISLDSRFGDILGFSQKDIDHGLTIAGMESKYENIIKDRMNVILNGYHFIG